MMKSSFSGMTAEKVRAVSLGVKNEHWEQIKNRFREDHPYEAFSEEFSDRVREVLGGFECEECQTLDYELKPIGDTGENVCRKCSEAEDEVY